MMEQHKGITSFQSTIHITKNYTTGSQ